jgi:hypothetical protein
MESKRQLRFLLQFQVHEHLRVAFAPQDTGTWWSFIDPMSPFFATITQHLPHPQNLVEARSVL